MVSKEARTWEFGDFQTPIELAKQALAHLREQDPIFRPKTIIEPTCGVGAFLLAAADAYPEADKIVGLEIDERYLSSLRAAVAQRPDTDKFELIQADFFQTDWEQMLAHLPEPFLIVGNPPWVTSADIGLLKGSNLPTKSNFQKYTGFEAVTGKANFDISEWMLIKNLEWVSDHSGCIAMLCKTSVARKLLRHAWKAGVPTTDSRMVQIDAMKHFSAAVDACFFSLKTNGKQTSTDCALFESFNDSKPLSVFGYHDGMMLSNVNNFYQHKELLGKNEKYIWRSGVKHDCSKVMELRSSDASLQNGYGQAVDIEDNLLYPLLKSSDLGNRRISATRFNVIVTQNKVGQDTESIQQHSPMTWKYLNKNSLALDGRRSSIYRGKPRFSMFGVGEYTFSKWKVAISGFYKRLDFQVVGPINGKPVVFDDTVYFLSADSEDEAKFISGLLNSKVCRDFLDSMIFWTDKRPITADVLKRIDLEKLAAVLEMSDKYEFFTKVETPASALA